MTNANTAMRNRARFMLTTLLTVACAAALASRAFAESYTSIDVPGASETRAHGINDRGEIVGFYKTAGQPFHGYLRTTDGVFHTLDYPGAVETRPQTINAPGDVAGDYADSHGGTHGFLWQRSNGLFTTIDFPGADLTVVFGVNSQGDVGGGYLAGGVFHGFLRLVDDGFVTINFPGAFWTIGAGINERGDIDGAYVDNGGAEHGYFRLARDGVFTRFDVPGAAGTEIHSGNARGDLVGPACITTSCLAPGPQRGFLRQRDGTVAFIDVPGAALTGASGINASGSIVGDYFDSSFNRHGFLRTPR